MTVSQGGLIQAADYNSLQLTVAKILGTTYDSSAPNYNYGLTTQINSSQVTAGSTITASDWTKLQLDILAAAAHQGTTSLISALVNTTISQNATINAASQTSFINAVSTIDSNRKVAVTRSSYNPGLTNSRTTAWGSTSKTSVTHSFTLTWPDYNSARYFFNLGSVIQFSASQSGGTAGWSQNANWQGLLSAMGTISYGIDGCSGQTAGTASTLVGWYDLTNTDKQIFTKAGTGTSTAYANNDYTILARCNVASNATGTATAVTFTINFNDDAKNKTATEPYTGGLLDTVDGTLTSTISIAKGTITDSGVTYTAPQPVATNGTVLAN